MDAIIQRYDFKKGNEKTSEKLEEELSDWSNEKMEDMASKKMTLKSLEVLQGKVCVQDFPSEESPGGAMALCAFENISDCIGHLISEEKAKAADYHSPFMDMLQKLLASGPGTTHLELISQLFNVSDVEFEEYFHTLKGEKIKKVLSWCKKEYKLREKISYDDYADKVERGMSCILDDGFTDEQCVDHRVDFLDLYAYFQYGFMDRKEEEKKLMDNLAGYIDNHLDRDPLKGAKDKPVFVNYLNCLKGIVLAKPFPSSDDVVYRVRDGLRHLFDGLKEAGNLKDLYEEIMDLSAAIFIQKAEKPVHMLIETIGYYFYHVEESHVKGNTKMFEFMCKRVTEILEQCKDHSLLAVRFVDAIVSEVLVKTMSNTPNHVVLLINLLKALIKIPLKTTMAGARTVLSEKDKALKWKDHVPAAKEIYMTIGKVKVPDDDEKEDVLDRYKDFTEVFLQQIKKARILEEFNEGLVDFALGILESNNKAMFPLGAEVAENAEFDSKKNKAQIVDVFKRLTPLLNDNSYAWMEDYELSSLTNSLVNNAINGIKNGNHLDEADYKVIVAMVKVVIVKDFIHEDTGEAGSVFYRLYATLTFMLLQKLDETSQLELAQPVFGHLIDLLDHELDDVRGIAEGQLQMVCRNGGPHLSQYLDKLVKAFIEHESSSLMSAISSAYPSNPEPVHRKFQELMKYLDTGDFGVKAHVIQLYVAVAKEHPEQFTEANLKSLWEEAKRDQAYSVQILMVLEDVAKKCPDKLGKMLPLLMDDKKLPQTSLPSHINFLKQLGIRSEKSAEPIIEHYMKTLRGPEEQTLFLCTLDGLRNVGGINLPLLTKHRDQIEAVKKNSQIQYIKDGCTGLIDVIEGRSLATVTDDMREVQDDVKELDTRVTQNEVNVTVVTKEVDKQKKDIRTVKRDVKTQGKKIDKLEDTVDETVAKVEEIDSKTLSHAPFWSRDVSKMLNPRDEHDWRLLSSRLGFNNDDIRGWAQQHDPCMAMLNEWYAVRKTSEGTFAVLTALQEMNRMDAAAIVENAMKMAETVVEDEPFEYSSPPAVFISYQWGVQNEVKLLKQHLEMAGYECWMDIGQMGGGDKLFEKIDQGIRGSKVIISCVTEKYAKSPNCNREVNLSVSLGRPIIPLLMEKQTWPPAGSMGPIFSEYLFIRFFTRSGEETGDQRYWSAAKFQELLMQLNYNGLLPQEDKVQKQYKNWWTPVVEEIKIEKKKDSGKSGQSQAKQTELAEKASVSPDVFISYQWGKQKQIMLLYRRLIGLGYSCWMDIHQMGGGDSLYDKIDRGVRGCRIVLSCVTSKYALSANCRREVSLADALKKPIVPLLMEKITWPPSGPMSMVLTQLLYINFSKDESVQERWAGKEFDELVGKIQSNVPSPESDGTSSEPSKNKNTGKPPPSQAKSPQGSDTRKSSSSPDKPKPKPESNSEIIKKDQAKTEPPSPTKPANNPEKKSKSCILL